MIRIDRLSLDQYAQCADFASSCEAGMLYHTPQYLTVLARILPPGAEPLLLVASEANQITASLAAFVLADDGAKVLNSLPYFGSHGDALLGCDEAVAERAASLIADELASIIRERDIGAVNIVSNLRNSVLEGRLPGLGLECWDSRVGQITSLQPAGSREEAFESVLATCHQKTRNLVRKGLRQGFQIERSTSDADWAQLIEHHQRSMSRIGGRAKTEAEFAAIRGVLQPLDQCRLFVARRDGAFAGALLNLYHRDWVEYFTPVSVEEFRNEQVLSALIAHAMAEAICEGRRTWNWGGTWSTQAGVYHFKQGWGAVDQPYRYLGVVRDRSLLEEDPQTLSRRFPYFYVRPYAR